MELRMPLQFTVLASGSRGNACYLNAGGFGLLLDAGLGPRMLLSRLAVVGVTWSKIHAVLLTHTHADHWKDRTLAQLLRQRIPIFCHPAHHAALLSEGEYFAKMQAAGLVQTYEDDLPCIFADGFQCRPVPLPHDCAATFGFRFQGTLQGQEWSLGYAADLGSWTEALAGVLADVDLLALEFNHDVDMEVTSGRPGDLIQRVLGDFGHLSNAQAAGLLRTVLQRSQPGRLQQLVQLHLSRECNLPEIAARAAQSVLADYPFRIAVHTALQDRPSPTFPVRTSSGAERDPAKPTCSPAMLRKDDRRSVPANSPVNAKTACLTFLPGWET